MKTINIKGVIVPTDDKEIYDWLGYDATSPGDVERALAEANGEEVEVLVNSGGGSVWAGTEIYTRLRQYAGHVLIRIQSMAASAAAVISMAGESEISPVAQIMIHNVSSGAVGDNRDMEHMADVLKTANEALASAFVDKTGKAQEEILDMMNRETWMTAQRAVEEGFVDRIMDFGQQNRPMQLENSAGPGLLPASLLDYARKQKNNQKKHPDQDMALARAQYEYLNLKKMEE